MPGDDELLQIGTQVDLTGAAQMDQFAAAITAATQKMRSEFASTTQQMQSQIDGLNAKLTELQAKLDSTGQHGAKAMNEARGAAMLLGHEIGVPLNRHLISFVTQIQGVGALLASAFSVIAIIGLIEWVVKLTEHFYNLSKEEEKVREEAVKVASSWQDTASKVIDQIDRQEQKLIELREGPIAALTAAINHFRSNAIEAFKAVSAELEKTAGVLSKQGGMFNAFGPASDELKKFQANLDSTMHKAQLLDSKNPFAGYQEGIDLTNQEIDKFQVRINALQAGPGGGIAGPKGKDLERLAKPWQDAIVALTNTNQLFGLYIQLQKDSINVDKGELGQKGSESKKKSMAEEKALLDELTKQQIDHYQMEFEEGSINSAQLEALKQAALDKQYVADNNYYEALKKLVANQPDELRKVIEEQKVLTIKYQDDIIKSYTATLTTLKKNNLEIDKQNTEFYNRQVEADNKRTESILRNIDKMNQKRVADIALIQGEGQKRIATIDAEIRKLVELSAEYHLEGQTLQNVYNQIHQLSIQRQKDLDDEMMHSGKMGQVMHATMNQMILDGQNWQVKVANQFEKSVNQMNQNLAQFITTGKANWRGMATSAIQSLIEIGLQYVESLALMALEQLIFGETIGDAQAGQIRLQIAAQAALAAAAAFADAAETGPFGLALAPAAAATAFAQVMAMQALVPKLDVGGLVERSGIAVVHKGEGVLTEKLTSAVLGMSSGGNIHFAPGSVIVSSPTGDLSRDMLVRIAKKAVRDGVA